MKIITFTVPCYNSADYMARCVDSLLTCGDDAQIIIVDDGSTDATGTIADAYAEAHPDIVEVIHKENGGHGSGVNAGLAHASGRYFKVVDSDDWLDTECLARLMKTLNDWEKEEHEVDLVLCNYVYDHLYENRTKAMRYKNVFDENKVCTWNDIKHFNPSQYLIMHALIYRTEILRECGIKLPKHTFFVDNLFAYVPLPYIESITYLNLDLYHYFLGRDDQSVNEHMLMKRIDQQLKVTKMVTLSVDLDAVGKKYPKLAQYMVRNVSIMVLISTIHLLLIGDDVSIAKRRELWAFIYYTNPKLFFKLRTRTLSGMSCLPGKKGREWTLKGYRFAKRLYEFQ